MAGEARSGYLVWQKECEMAEQLRHVCESNYIAGRFRIAEANNPTAKFVQALAPLIDDNENGAPFTLFVCANEMNHFAIVFRDHEVLRLNIWHFRAFAGRESHRAHWRGP
jgi:hypothetical protein